MKPLTSWKTLIGIPTSLALLPAAFMLTATNALLGQCPIKTDAIDAGQPLPTINTVKDGDKFVSGKVLDGKGNPAVGMVQVCINDAAAGAKQKVGADGTYSAGPGVASAGQSVKAQFFPAAGGNPSGVQSATVTAAKPTLTFSPVSPLGMAVAGLDISGASSTSPSAVFLGTAIMDVPVMGASKHNPNGQTDYSYDDTWWFSGYLRIAGMAQPGTLSGNVGDLASTGTYLSSAVNATPDKIVQSIEADASAAFQLGHWFVDTGSFDVGTFAPTAGRPKPSTLFTVSLVASVGAITPLSASQANPPVYYLTQQIMTVYGVSPSGCSYTTSTPPCYVAFVPSDRTHFYRNYEAGFRLKTYAGDYADTQPEYRFPAMADVTVGQNEYVTGGRFHSAVLHIGGTMPVPTVDSVYIFGSMDLGLNFKYGQENPQLLLTPVPSSENVTYLSPSVNTISVSQPNRDRYRLGFGVDIFHLISAIKAKSK